MWRPVLCVNAVECIYRYVFSCLVHKAKITSTDERFLCLSKSHLVRGMLSRTYNTHLLHQQELMNKWSEPDEKEHIEKRRIFQLLMFKKISIRCLDFVCIPKIISKGLGRGPSRWRNSDSFQLYSKKFLKELKLMMAQSNINYCHPSPSHVINFPNLR